MSELFSASTYKHRREQLRARMSQGQVLLLGNKESSMNYKDNHYRFRQDSCFLYFFGIDLPGMAAVIDLDNDEEVIFGNELTMEDIVWTGPQPGLTELADKVGVASVKPLSELAGFLKSQVHFIPPYRPENAIKLSSLLGLSLDSLSEKSSSQLIRGIIAIRSIKTAEEITQLHHAVSITARMHIEAMKCAKPGMKESEVASRMHQIALGEGAGVSFPPIITVNGQTLHNHYYGNTMTEGKLLLVDGGGESTRHYSGDMTRTFPVSSNFTSQQKEVYEIVLGALKGAAAQAQPGIANRDVHLGAAKYMAHGLKALGLMKGDIDEAVAEGAHALFYPHGLGHMMGMDVHDMEDLGENEVGYGLDYSRSTQFGLSALRLGKPLEKGFVLTIEPGLYFIPELVANWKSEKKNEAFLNYAAIEKYLDFGGIRIENDYHITESGSELLGIPVPMEVSDVESLRSS